MKIMIDDLSHPQVHELLREHLAGMHANSPADCVYALDLASLKAPQITFWTAWDGDDLLGCGAMNQLSETHAEVKSIRTAQKHLRKGVARQILATILQEAQQRAYCKVSLETGSTEGFHAAHALYASCGFERCGPFGHYQENPFSVFMTKELRNS